MKSNRMSCSLWLMNDDDTSRGITMCLIGQWLASNLHVLIQISEKMRQGKIMYTYNPIHSQLKHIENA